MRKVILLLSLVLLSGCGREVPYEKGEAIRLHAATYTIICYDEIVYFQHGGNLTPKYKVVKDGPPEVETCGASK